MRNRHIQNFLAGCIASLFIFAAGASSAATYIGSNIIVSGTTIEVLGPHADLDIQAIIDSITDASGTKPYVIKLGPGLYDLGTDQLVMQAWVSIHGAGQRSTLLTSTKQGVNPQESAVLVGASNAELTDLAVAHLGAEHYSVAILNDGASPYIERVYAVASGGTSASYGVFNRNNAGPPMFDVETTAAGASGITNGVRNDSSFPFMDNVIALAYGGTRNIGVDNRGISKPIIKNSTLQGRDGNASGVANSNTSVGTRIVNSLIVGGFYNQVAKPDNKKNCRGNYDADLNDVDC